MEADYSYFEEDNFNEDDYEEDVVVSDQENDSNLSNENMDGDTGDGDDEEQEEEDIGLIQKLKSQKHEIVPYTKTYETYYSVKKVTKPFITKFEKAKLLGVRAEMIASGAPAMVNVPRGITSAYVIAQMEYKAKKIPLLVRRYLPNGQYEDWRLEDMVIN